MYPSLYTAPLLVKQQNGDHRPIFFCEYAHAMGNSGGNIKEFWDQWRSLKRVIGGCIWEFKDQALIKKDSAGNDYYAYGGDFGEKYFDDFTIKGLVAADGRPKAVMYECKHVFQPVNCSWADSIKGLLHVVNMQSVRNLKDFDMVLDVQEDGFSIKTIKLPPLSVNAAMDTVINIAAYLPPVQKNHEYFLNIHFLLSSAQPWAEKGFEVASDQLVITGLSRIKVTGTKMPSLNLDETQNNFTIKGNDFTIQFSKRNGALSSYIWKGTEQVFSALLPHFTRPLTDNDKRGWKADKVLKQWFDGTPKLVATAVKHLPSGVITVSSKYSMIQDSAAVLIIFTINGKGAIKVDYSLEVKDGLPNLPKVGMQCGINKTFDHIQWYGRGLLENYVDRRSGFPVGVYSQPLNQFIEPYVVPQENGNRTDVRWMFLQNEQKKGLLIVADSLLSMSAWPYTEQNIQNAKHTNKLRDAGFITLNIDMVQMGVGGNDSWSGQAAPLNQYQIKAKPYHYSFYIMPYSVLTQKISEVVSKTKF
jgi:beta-galactosidase